MATSQARAVCVVDDDVSLPRALQILLRAAGFTVGAFGSAEEFLHAARAAVAHYSPSNAFLIAMEVLEQHYDLEQVRALLGPLSANMSETVTLGSLVSRASKDGGR